MVNWYRAALQIRNEIPDSFRVTVPTLILWGVENAAIIPELAEQSLSYCDKGQLVKFDQATHWLQHEEAEEVNALMDEFFRHN